jgi:hypothetical protein
MRAPRKRRRCVKVQGKADAKPGSNRRIADPVSVHADVSRQRLRRIVPSSSIALGTLICAVLIICDAGSNIDCSLRSHTPWRPGWLGRRDHQSSEKSLTVLDAPADDERLIVRRHSWKN